MNREKYAKRLALWRVRIQDCEGSKLPITVWCRQNGYKRRDYYYYRTKIREFDEKGIEIAQYSAETSKLQPTPLLTIQQGDLQLHFYKDADPEYIMTIINAITGIPKGAASVTHLISDIPDAD